MNLEIIASILAWCTTINVILLAIWLLTFIFAHDWMYNMHKKWFVLSLEKFDAIHYVLIGTFKLATLIFYLVPYLVIRSFL